MQYRNTAAKIINLSSFPIHEYSEFWDKIALHGDYQNKALRDYMTSQYANLISRWLGTVRNKSILKTDVYEEAFHNKSVLEIFRWGNRITGIDVSKIVINKVKEKPCFNYIRSLKVGDRKNRIFKKSEFDIVLSLSTLDHLPKNELSQALNSINYELKKCGMLILSLNNSHNIMFYAIHKLDSLFRLKFPSNFYSMVEAKESLAKSGFKVINEDYIIFIPPFFRTFINLIEKSGSKRLNKIACLMVSGLNIKNSFFRKFFGYYLVVHAEKS